MVNACYFIAENECCDFSHKVDGYQPKKKLKNVANYGFNNLRRVIVKKSRKKRHFHEV